MDNKLRWCDPLLHFDSEGQTNHVGCRRCKKPARLAAQIAAQQRPQILLHERLHKVSHRRLQLACPPASTVPGKKRPEFKRCTAGRVLEPPSTSSGWSWASCTTGCSQPTAQRSARLLPSSQRFSDCSARNTAGFSNNRLCGRTDELSDASERFHGAPKHSSKSGCGKTDEPKLQFFGRLQRESFRDDHDKVF